jgi:hypothetical protein
MQFLNPWFLFGSLAIVGPILVHLIRREDSKKIPFSSLMFVTRLPKRSLRQQSLRHLLLLALRVAALFLLALAFARPFFFSQLAAPLKISNEKSLVILLDNSFSMQSAGAFEKAKQDALRLIGSLSSRDTAQVVVYSDTTRLLNTLQTDRSSLRSTLSDVRPDFRKTNHLAALKLAGQLLSSAPNERLEIHWFSDFQQTGWTENTEDVTIPEKIRIEPHRIPPDDGNTSVSQVQLSRVNEGDAELMRLSARVASYASKTPGARRVSLEVGGKSLQQKTLSLKPDDSQLVEFEPFSPLPGLTKGEIKLDPPDALPADNVFHFTLNSQQRLRLLLLQEKGRQDSFYIAKALSAGKDSPFQIELQDVGQGEALDLTRFSGVVLNNAGVLSPKLAAAISDFVQGGGGLLILLGDRVRPNEINQRLERVLPSLLATPSRPRSGAGPSFIGEVQKQHPVFSVFQPIHYSYFLRTPFSTVVPSKPAESSQVLARLEDGTPLLVERAVGKGRCLLFASSLNMDWNDLPLNMDWNDLPLKSVFVPLLHQIVKYSLHYDEAQYAFAVGEVVPMGKLNPMLGKALNKISGTGNSFSQSWRVTTPSGQKTELQDAELLKSPFFELEEPGFYQSRVHNFDSAVAVNIVPAESDVRAIAPEKILASIKRTGFVPAGTAPIEATLDQRRVWESKQGLWWYLLVLALALLAVESFISNRYYRGAQGS